MKLTEWSDFTIFKSFCLDRLAVGISASDIATELSGILARTISESMVLDSCTGEEIKEKRLELLQEVRDSAPVISRELMSTMGRVKHFIDLAEKKFNSSELRDSDFDSYRRALELKIKAIETASNQIDRLSDSTRTAPVINVSFDFSKLKALEDEGLVKIIDVEAVKELVGSEDGSEKA